MDDKQRGIRGRSAELDGKRINAVSPMHLGESKMLQNLWKEAQMQSNTTSPAAATATAPPPSSTTVIPPPPPIEQQSNKQQMIKVDDGDRKLQIMLDKYQNQVKLQQQQSQRSVQPKSMSRNNINQLDNTPSRNRPSGEFPATTQDHSNNHPHPMSHSQPCLIAITDRPPDYFSSTNHSEHQSMRYAYNRRASGSGEHNQPDATSANGNQQRQVPNNQKLIQSLREENLHLKKEMEPLKKKLARLQQIESAHERIEKDYESLLRDRERQESLEKTALVQMDAHLKRMAAEKEELQNRLLHVSLPNSQAMDKINQLNLILAEVIPKNTELSSSNERQRMEIAAQNTTLEEQRKHITMLENALTNAQERLAKREKAMEELSMHAERANHLQRLLHETLMDKQARDEAHQAERSQWEMEMTQLKMQINKDASQSGSLKRTNGPRLSIDNGDEAMNRMKKTIHAKDDRILHLEKNVVELQKKLWEECEKKKNAMGALSDNLEAKIKLLEEDRSEKDRRIAELTDDREKLIDLLGCEREKEAEEARDSSLNKMEEMRQKIQERKRKGRVGTTGGLMGMQTDHTRTASGAFIPTSTHMRSSSGPFDTSILLAAPSSYLSEISSTPRTSALQGSTKPYQHIFQQTHDPHNNGTSSWNV